MLKHVALSDLEQGMYVQKMLGSWFDHPFWKKQFLIEDAEKLAILKASNLDGVIIDTSKGKPAPAADTPVRNDVQSIETATAVSKPAKKRRSLVSKPVQPVGIEQELRAAQGVADRARHTLEKTFLAARLGKAMNVRAVEPVVREIQTSIQRNPQAFSGLMRCKLTNEFVYRHALAVSALMVSLAKRMKLSDKETHEAGLAGMMLDIGTNHLPKAHAPKNGNFRNAPPAIWQQHVMLGHRALLNDDCFPQAVLDACLQHHERMDGSGFPNGTRGEDISRIGRMAAICDAFDFMLIETENSRALDPALAIRKLNDMSLGFDPDILRHFVESVGIFPIGSFVELRSKQLAMVVDENPNDQHRPVVLVFYSLTDEERVLPHRVALAKCSDGDEIIGSAELGGLGLPDDAQLRDLLFLGAMKAR